MRPPLLILTFSCLLAAYGGFAQRTTVDLPEDTTKNPDDYEDKSYFEASVEYVSSYQYLGRKDTARLPYIMTSFGYYFKSGFHIAASPWYANTKVNPHFDLIMLDLGYDHTFSDAFSGGAILYKYYYSEESKSVKSTMTASAGVYAQYSNGYVDPVIYIGGDVVNHNMDAVISVGLQHTFQVNDRLSIIPSATIWYGTQYYYSAYLQKDSAKRPALKLNSANKLKLMDAEFIVTAIYETYKWTYSLGASYVLPRSPGQVTLQKTTFEEQISNTFSVDIKVARRFFKKQKRKKV